jgi:RHS repeat-associated protein
MNNAAGDKKPTKGGSVQNAGGVGGLLKEGDWYPTYDANGNIMQKLDGAGAMVMNVDYDPFGRTLGHSGSISPVGEYGFSTKPYVTELHCYYYGYRYYDPLSGRWQSRDPIGEAGHEILKPSFRNTLLLLSQLNSSRDAVRVQLEYLRVRLSDFSSLSPHEFEMLYAEFLEGLTELSRLSQMKQVIEDGLYPDNFNSEYSSYRFLHNNGIDYIDVNGEWGFVGAFVAIATAYVVANIIAEGIEAVAAGDTLLRMDNSCVTQGGSIGNPAFSSQMNDVQDAVHEIAEGCPNTSLTGPAGVPARLAEAVGAAANAIMKACGN